MIDTTDKVQSFANKSLPKGWLCVIIEDLCQKTQYGWTTKASNKGKVKLLRTTDITSGSIDWNTVPYCSKAPDDLEKYLLKNGDVVISRAGSIGYSHLIKNPPESVFASYLIRFIPLIDETYFSYFLKSPRYWAAISERKLGIAVQNVNATKLKAIPIPLPPLAEQKRIVSKIEELFTKLDAGVEALKKVRQELKRYRQSVLKHAFEGKLTEQWREKHKDKLEPASEWLRCCKEALIASIDGKPKKIPNINVNKMSPLPNEWEVSQIGEISNVVRGGSPRPAGDPRYFGGDIPWITVKEITKDSNIYLTGVSRYVTELGKQKSRYIEPNTFLLTNSGATLGVPKITRIGGCINDGSVALLGLGDTFKVYLYYFLTKLTKELRQLNQGAAQPNLNTGIVSAIKIPVPQEKEQGQIVQEIERHFSVADHMEQAIEQSLKQSDRLRQSILKKAFEGKLVPQDPEDEPAEKLLERIKAEKEKVQARPERKKVKTKKRRRRAARS